MGRLGFLFCLFLASVSGYASATSKTYLIKLSKVVHCENTLKKISSGDHFEEFRRSVFYLYQGSASSVSYEFEVNGYSMFSFGREKGFEELLKGLVGDTADIFDSAGVVGVVIAKSKDHKFYEIKKMKDRVLVSLLSRNYPELSHMMDLRDAGEAEGIDYVLSLKEKLSEKGMEFDSAGFLEMREEIAIVEGSWNGYMAGERTVFRYVDDRAENTDREVSDMNDFLRVQTQGTGISMQIANIKDHSTGVTIVAEGDDLTYNQGEVRATSDWIIEDHNGSLNFGSEASASPKPTNLDSDLDLN